MRGLIYYLELILGKTPTKSDKTHAQKELEFFMKGKYGGRLGRFVHKGERFKRPYKEKKKLKPGESEVVGRFSRIVNHKDEI